MDTTTLRTAIKQVINHYAKLQPSHGDIRLEAVFDETHDRYALMQVGWNRDQRVRGNLIYITIHNTTVNIEYDGIEQGITQDLLEQGIPAESIVHAFLSKSPVAMAM
ncbi:MAG: XisI protein [Alkalinema sp. RU_4_3]|nr:XisI protein [Alkalinema sp. RU_4_3]